MKIYTEEEDYFNSFKTRNAENTDKYDYNCGGYALNTFSWYRPYEDDDEDPIEPLIEEGFTKEEIYEIKLGQYVSTMLNDFPNLRVLTSPTDVKKSERLIFFRFFYELEDEDEDGYYSGIHTDFHYRFFDSDCWKEKCGRSDTRICKPEEMEGVWDCGSNHYDSRTVYLALKLED